MNVRRKLISAAVVLPVVMSAPTVAAADSTPTPEPTVTDPTLTPPDPTPSPTDPTPTESAEPVVTETPSTVAQTPPPAEQVPVQPVDPAASFGTIPATTAYTEPRSKRARATKRTSRAGVSMRTRGVRYSPMTAVFRLTQWARKGRSGYRNGCLRLADDAYGVRSGRTSTALRQWYRSKRQGYGHRNRRAPIGAQLFWRTSHPAGHVATYIGRGLVVTNVGSGRVRIMPWRSVDRWGPYLGWAEPYYR